MPHINVLDKNTIDKIAAGEVIERPASVVKELLENAIDAKATAVTVEIRDGGISFIRVTDNGCGIPKDEIALAFLRHSTSKIQSAEDLFTVSSLGFRGEALSSIAAVAQVEVITKTGECLTGTRYQIEGGQEKSIEEVGAPDGTTFIVRNLFFNTPARKKFLKTAHTEGAHTADLVEKIALSHPEVSIRLIQNNQNKLHTSGNHNLKDMIYTIFGREIAANLLAVEAEEGAAKVTGFIGKPVIARSSRSYENYYINGRYIKSPIIAKGIEEAYKPYLMQHKYPFTLLHFSIKPEFLDVNVHPTKMELRFQDREGLYQMVLSALRSALSHKELIPEVNLSGQEEQKKTGNSASWQENKDFHMPEPFEINRMKQLHIIPSEAHSSFKMSPETAGKRTAVSSPGMGKKAMVSKESEKEKSSPRGSSFQGISEDTEIYHTHPARQAASFPQPEYHPEQLDLFDGKLLEPESRKRHTLIGQLFDTYWLVEFEGNLYIIDQHAAHEKVLYEQMMESLKKQEHASQAVNPPVILTLNTSEELLLKKHETYFTRIGFEIEPFGGREYAVRGVPSNLFSIAKKELLMEMIDRLSEDVSLSNPDIIYEKIASMSCKAAVKGNHRMSIQEANELIDRLLTLDNPYSCPHGRPTIISMSKYELEKKFKRIV
ncbi:DNA mismatch repair endonuclease MutL [Lachnospiraceae bacterium 62-35]